MEYKLMIAVRKDLKLSHGKMAVQVAHAAVGCTLECQKRLPRIFSGWLEQGQKKVVVKVATIREIFDLKEKARRSDIIFHVVTDAGRTEVEPGTITCIGLGPDKESILDDLTGELKLV